MMSYCWVSKDQVKKHAEVFTPAGVVFFMVLQDGIRELVQGIDKTVFDPAVGEGQFPCAELVLKMFYNSEKLNEATALVALSSLYGMDIQQESVEKTHEHLIKTLCDAYKFFTGEEFTAIEVAKKIVEKNFWQGDSIKQMKKWTAPQQELF